MNRKGNRNNPCVEVNVTKETYPKIVWQGYVDKAKFYGTCRVVKQDYDIFKFEREDGDDAMGNPVWKPITNEDQYRSLAIHFVDLYLKHTENAETPTNE